VGEKPKPRATPEPARSGWRRRRRAIRRAPARWPWFRRPRESSPTRPRRNASPSLRAEVKTQDELEIATLRGKVAFFEEENRKLKVQVKQVQEQAAHDASASPGGRGEDPHAAQAARGELKKLQKELDEKETYYSPAELRRERKRMEAAIEAERRRIRRRCKRQIKDSSTASPSAARRAIPSAGS